MNGWMQRQNGSISPNMDKITVLLEYQTRSASSLSQSSLIHRLRRNFYPVQPEPLGRLLPPTAVAVFPAAAMVNHSCDPNACFHARRAGPGGPPLEYVLRCMNDVAAGEEVCVSYLAHFAPAAKEVCRTFFPDALSFSAVKGKSTRQ